MQHINALETLGFNVHFKQQLDTFGPLPATWHIGRISQATRGHFQLLDHTFPQTRRAIESSARAHVLNDTPPSTGDWVIFSKQLDACTIEHVLPRHTALTRARVGSRHHAQVVAANIDVVFIVSSMNQEFNPSRLERYLVAVWNSGATPVIILSKADLADDPEAFIDRANELAMGVRVFAISSSTGDGTAPLLDFIEPHKTYAFVGSSGVGKSTLHNLILGQDLAKTQGIREDDDEGRHTTTHRYLTCLPDGGLLIDTPGMREFGLWHEQDEGVQHTFSDIEDLASSCRFRDCSHQREPGCAIQGAIERGDLKHRRLRNYQKLLRELAHQESRQNKSKSREANKKQGKYFKKIKKHIQAKKSY